MNPQPRYASTTLVSTSSYVIGALVLGYSLRRSGWPHETVALVTPDIGPADRQRLAGQWQHVVEVEPIANPNPSRDQGHAHFGTTYTKLRLWGLTQYAKVIFIDADAVVVGPLEDLLERPAFAAAPDMGGLDLFNAGVLVADPSAAVLQDMLGKLETLSAYDGSVQGFLNAYFPDWYTGPPEPRLPTRYNVPYLHYSYRPSWDQLSLDIRVIHLLGAFKPWQEKIPLVRRLFFRLFFKRHKLGSGPHPFDIWRSLHREMEL